MATLKYSRQRESIQNYLNQTNDHPTAETVYLNVKNEYPNISLGTVYRNLNLLAEMGEVLKISTPNGGDRFDGHMHPHYHFCCNKCGRVIDLDLGDLSYINKEAEDLIRNGDVVISKGQGNFESLNGCGLNIYYLFLCKCDWFVRRFQMKRLTGVLINGRNLV